METITGRFEVLVDRDGRTVGKLIFDPDDLAFLNKYYGLIEGFETKEKEFDERGKAPDFNKEVDRYSQGQTY